MYYTYMPSPIGQLLLAGTRDALQIVGFPSGDKARGAERGWERDDAPFEAAAAQLREYFEGERTRFELELDPSGTPFQRAVLDALVGFQEAGGAVVLVTHDVAIDPPGVRRLSMSDGELHETDGPGS